MDDVAARSIILPCDLLILRLNTAISGLLKLFGTQGLVGLDPAQLRGPISCRLVAQAYEVCTHSDFKNWYILKSQ